MKTSELTGAALDWAVTKCEGFDHEVTSNEWGLWGWATDWAQGGPIIEREHTEFDFDEDTQLFHAYDGVHGGVGPTHLVAAMRCYVASRLGDNVDVPKELS